MSSYWKHAILSGPAPQYSSCLACLACLACSPSALLPCRHQRFVCVCGVYMCICTYIHNHAHAHTHMLFTPASSHRASSAHRERPRERERGEGGERGRRGRKGGTGRGNDSCWHIPHVGTYHTLLSLALPDLEGVPIADTSPHSVTGLPRLACQDCSVYVSCVCVCVSVVRRKRELSLVSFAC